MKTPVFALTLLLFLPACYAEEKVQAQGFNEDAIPEVITPKDRKVSVSPTTYVSLKRADYILKDVRIGGQKIPSAYEQHVDRKQKENLTKTPSKADPSKNV